MRIVDRLFTQIRPKINYDEDATKSLPAFFNKPTIVVLGDPGSGKTTSFLNAAETEGNAVYVRIRDFLALDVKKRWKDKTLYLDGLDEQRAKTEDGSAVLDQIRCRLDDLGCPPFRLSCRADDWYGSSDAESLSLVSSDNSVTILILEPLKESDIITIVGDTLPSPESFIKEAQSKGIFELLTNPQTLKMIFEVVLHEGKFPNTRTELFQKTAEILIAEHNPDHDRIYEEQYSDERILEAAGYLCAIQLCGGIEGFALSKQQANRDFVFVPELNNDRKITSLAVRRRVFISKGSERVIPVHRTIFEFFAAYFLAQHIREGFSIDRIIAIITGNDGGILTDLRGLYAWLACLCQEYMEILIPKDPFGVILYGDIKPLNYTIKKLTFNSLIELTHRNPWFRSEDYSFHPFGGLAAPDMIPIFRDVLENKSEHPVIVGFTLDAIRYGKPLPQLCDLLFQIVRDNKRLEYIRYEVLKTFLDICPSRESDLLDLLKDIHEGKIKDDKHNNLRGNLLNSLYQNLIGTDEIVSYLVKEDPNFIGEYYRFIAHGIIEKTDPQDLVSLIDHVINSDIRERGSYLWELFKGRLLLETLTYYGDKVDASKLYKWLGIAFDKRGFPKDIRKDESEVIHKWIENRPGRIRDLFKYWVNITPPENLRRKEHYFWERLFRVEPPKNFARWLLKWIDSDPNNPAIDFLFITSLQILTQHNREDAPKIEEFIQFAEKHPYLRKSLDHGLYCEISEWRIKSALRNKKYKEEQERNKSEKLRWLMENLEEISQGGNYNKILFLAKVYFGHFVDIDRNIPPMDRIVELTNQLVAKAASKGFIAMLHNAKIQSPAEIGKSHTQSKVFHLGFPILSGMDLLAERSIDEILKLPDETLKAALAFHFANDNDPDRFWLKELIKKRPELSSDSLLAFWRPHFINKSDHIPGLYQLANDESFDRIARQTVLPLLNEFPNVSEYALKTLLYSAFQYSEHSDLLDLSNKVLAQRGLVRGANRVYWYATGFLLDPDTFSDKLIRYIGKSKEKLELLINFISSVRDEDKNIDIKLAPKQISILIKISGLAFKPRDSILEGVPSRKLPNYIGTLIDQLSNHTNREVTEIFSKLCSDQYLIEWRKKLKNAFETHLKNRREAEFRYPTPSQIISTLARGSPANNSDLQALVYSQLCVIREELRHGPTDGYKMFWNIDSYSRPIKDARPEDDGRDRILERLRPNLLTKGIQAEPEGRYAEQKRADIKVLYSRFNLPIEIKRHYHKELWNAPINQLKKLYMRDPDAGQLGIYLAFWYGTDYKNPPRPPKGISMPKTAGELELALELLIPERDKELIRVIVFDVSRPLK